MVIDRIKETPKLNSTLANESIYKSQISVWISFFLFVNGSESFSLLMHRPFRNFKLNFIKPYWTIVLLYYFSPFIGIRNLWCAQVLLDWNQIYDFDNFEKINTYYNLFYYIYSYINYCQKSIENEIIVLHWK